MVSKVENFIHKKGLKASQIMYMVHTNRKTTIYLKDKTQIETFHPMKNLIAAFPPETFEVINKGVAVASQYITNVEKNIYTMRDGATFTGRIRSMKEHRLNEEKYGNIQVMKEWDQISILDQMPIAVCIIELIFDEDGNGMDAFFCYCNREMEKLTGKSMDEMINQSFYDVFENGDKKWLSIYADVAVNGTTQVIENYSFEADSTLRIHCFQPQPNYCACALVRI